MATVTFVDTARNSSPFARNSSPFARNSSPFVSQNLASPCQHWLFCPVDNSYKGITKGFIKRAREASGAPRRHPTLGCAQVAPPRGAPTLPPSIASPEGGNHGPQLPGWLRGSRQGVLPAACWRLPGRGWHPRSPGLRPPRCRGPPPTLFGMREGRGPGRHAPSGRPQPWQCPFQAPPGAVQGASEPSARGRVPCTLGGLLQAAKPRRPSAARRGAGTPRPSFAA